MQLWRDPAGAWLHDALRRRLAIREDPMRLLPHAAFLRSRGASRHRRPEKMCLPRRFSPKQIMACPSMMLFFGKRCSMIESSGCLLCGNWKHWDRCVAIGELEPLQAWLLKMNPRAIECGQDANARVVQQEVLWRAVPCGAFVLI